MKWVRPRVRPRLDGGSGAQAVSQQEYRGPVETSQGIEARSRQSVLAVWAWAWRILVALALVGLATFALYCLTGSLEKPAALYPGEN